jgi:hypothetical protein
MVDVPPLSPLLVVHAVKSPVPGNNISSRIWAAEWDSTISLHELYE